MVKVSQITESPRQDRLKWASFVDHLCYLCFVLVSWSTSELKMRLTRSETGLSPPVKYFTDRSKAALLLWIFYVFFSVLRLLCLVYVCLNVPCGHLLGSRL